MYSIIDKRGGTQTDQKGLNSNFWQSINNAGTAGYDGAGVSDLALLASYVNNDVVFTCADKNAQQVAQTPWCLFSTAKQSGKGFKKLSPIRKAKLRTKQLQGDEAEVVEVTNHPLIDLLTKTNEDLNGVHILKATQLYLEVLGRAYWYLEDRDADGIPLSIRVLKAHLVNPIRDIEGKVTGYLYTNVIEGNKNEVNLLKEDIIDFRNPSLTDLYAGGMSWLRATFNKVATGNKFTEYLNWLLDNRARPDYIISPKGEMNDPSMLDRLEKKFTDKLKGSNNGRPIVNPDPIDVKLLNFSPTDMAPLQVNGEMVKAVCGASGYPYVFVMGDATYANMESAMELWGRQTISPKVLDLEQVLNDSLVPLFGDSLYIEFGNPVPEDEQFELEEQKVNILLATEARSSGQVTVDEYRCMLGLPPAVEGGDELMKAPVPPAANAAGAEPADDVEADPVAGNAAESQPQPLEGKGLDILAVLAINKAVAAGELDRATAINLVAELVEGDQHHARQLVTHPAIKACACGTKAKAKPKLAAPAFPETNPALKAIVAHTFAIQRQHFEGLVNSLGTKGFNATNKAADGLPSEFVPIEQWTKELAHAVKPVVELEMTHAADGRRQALTRVGASPDVFSVIPAKVKEGVDKSTLRLSQSTISTTTQNLNDALAELRKQLKEGLIEGDGIPELKNRVKEIFDSADDDRAELIAHSETSRAVHEGQRIAAKASGIVKGFKLLVSDDACPLCESFADKEIGLDDKFNEGDDYDDSVLPIHPACRCTMLEVLNPEDDE